jgi:predicted nucleic acid-binding protein
MTHKAIVLDANILIRAVLGKRARSLIENYALAVNFFTPDIAFEDARRYLPEILQKRGIPNESALMVLEHLGRLVQSLPEEYYNAYRKQSLHRISARDPDDWPIVACSLALNCPVWTEDTDFFGAGIATWTTNRVEYYLSE